MAVIARTPPSAMGIRDIARRRVRGPVYVCSFFFFLLLAYCGVAAAEPAGPGAALVVRDGSPRLQTQLLVRRDADDRLRVGVLFDLAPGWHVYWRSSGDTGLPPELSWEVAGAETGPTLWPTPVAFHAGSSEEGLASYGYVGRVLLANDLRFESRPPEGTTLAVDADVLVCEHECVPATFRLERALGSALSGMGEDTERKIFTEFGEQVPVAPDSAHVKLEAVYSQSAIRPGDPFEGAIFVRSAEWRAASFFPDDSDPLQLRVLGVEAHPAEPETDLVTFAGVTEPDERIELTRLTGVLGLASRGGKVRAVEVNVPFPTAESGATVAMLGRPWLGSIAPPAGLGLLRALALALLGGLILNLMPCVLPVLAIKVFSISQMAEAARESRGEVLRHGIAYTVGILGSMAVLGACVLTLRAAGHSVGWGFQFQEPIYVAGISAVLVAFAANLFGVFEIRAGVGTLGSLGQQATGARRSFFEGLLAVALATPCSAPFLGTAVGFAFASEPVVILAIFLAVGLGLAAPFALITLIPSWARFVPRSGAWMGVVRSGLGFALLATTIWLLWIFGGSAGTDGVVTLISFLLGLAFALWCFGLLQRSAYQRTALGAGFAVLLLGAAGLNAVGTQIADAADRDASPTVGQAFDSGWETWSPGGVQSALDDGAPVFVRFTADWCITCKVNERMVLSRSDVRGALDEAGFRLFVGDWTHRDEAIRKELSLHGRAGVPLYLLYHPARRGSPELLPELLTVDGTLAALREMDHPQSPKPTRSARR